MNGLHFDGPDYTPHLDQSRLTGQMARIIGVMADGQWRTLGELEHAAHAPQASISAQLRHLRKPRFGSYRVDKRRRGEASNGLYEYRVREPLPSGQLALTWAEV